MKKLALIVAMKFGATGVVLAADATPGAPDDVGQYAGRKEDAP
jgi:hypothetical protein